MTSNDWISVFKWFHGHPELGFQETATTNKIREILETEGIEIISTDLSTGLVAVIRGKQEEKSVCLRADIDALPIQEQTDLPYSSHNCGVMHACGHDFHITVTLAAAVKLNRMKDRLNGTLYIALQPGEEVFGGAEKVLQTGVLDNVSEFYGFHADPALRVGEVGIKEDGVMAAVDRFRIDVKGTGTHAATPHLGNNPISVMTSLISALQNFAVREIPPSQSHVVSFTHISGGNAWNIIPEATFCEGTARTFRDQDRRFIRDSFSRIVHGFGEMTGTACELEWISGPPAVINDRALCEAARVTAAEAGLNAVDFVPEMISDDFSFFTEQTVNSRGLYLKIGTGIGFPLHHPKFQIDLAAITPAVELISRILWKTLT